MGLLSKIFGGDGDEVEKAAKDLLQGIFGGSSQDNGESGDGSSDGAENVAPATEDNNGYTAPSGDSWGEDIPAEENQYNYNGTYIQYFENIFGTEFGAYRYEKTTAGNSSRTIYTFYNGAVKALVIELMPESSSVYKLRKECEKENIPYLRFYYNHDGWWNTRSYVVGRIGKYLN